MHLQRHQLLEKLNFGGVVAEEEQRDLAEYFVETTHWKKVSSGEADIIYGAKGSGKSAIYGFLLSNREDFLTTRNIHIVPAENPRGTPVFRQLAEDPPSGDFGVFWKLYITIVIVEAIRPQLNTSAEGRRLLSLLQQAGLLGSQGLAGILRRVARYVRDLGRGSTWSAGVTFDPLTGAPGINASLTLGSDEHPETNQALDPDRLIEALDDLTATFGFSVWVALDRLDVAFENAGIEETALSALFRTYLDFVTLKAITLKIFIRDDIWRRITAGGFREATHVTRETTIQWDDKSLIHLVCRRILRNEEFRNHFRLDAAAVLASAQEQREILQSLLPRAIPTRQYSNVPGIDWMFMVTRDGRNMNGPREVLRLLRHARERELILCEIGGQDDTEAVLSVASLKEALVSVSTDRLERVIFAEYPTLREVVDALRRGRSSLTLMDVADAWGMSEKEALDQARILVDIGFLESGGKPLAPVYRIPPLHGAAMELEDCDY